MGWIMWYGIVIWRLRGVSYLEVFSQVDIHSFHMGFRWPKNGCNLMGRSWDMGKVNNLAMCGVSYFWGFSHLTVSRVDSHSFHMGFRWPKNGCNPNGRSWDMWKRFGDVRRLILELCGVSCLKLDFFSTGQSLAGIWWVDREIWRKPFLRGSSTWRAASLILLRGVSYFAEILFSRIYL